MNEATARLAQLVERKALNLVVVGSSPTVGAFLYLLFVFEFFEAFRFWNAMQRN